MCIGYNEILQPITGNQSVSVSLLLFADVDDAGGGWVILVNMDIAFIEFRYLSKHVHHYIPNVQQNKKFVLVYNINSNYILLYDCT